MSQDSIFRIYSMTKPIAFAALMMLNEKALFNLTNAVSQYILAFKDENVWGGYTETFFWIDPKEGMIAILMSQYLPSQTFSIRKEFRTAVYQALIS